MHRDRKAGLRGRHLEDGERGLGDGARRHGDAVLGRVALVDGDDLEARGRDLEVCEPRVLQVVEVALGQRVPGENEIELKKTYHALVQVRADTR